MPEAVEQQMTFYAAMNTTKVERYKEKLKFKTSIYIVWNEFE